MRYAGFAGWLAAVLIAALVVPAMAQLNMAQLNMAQPRATPVLDKVSFGTNWVAEAEHGGFFQAVADGTYAAYGLDVKLVTGGPNINNRILLAAGKLDFFMAANCLQLFDAVANNTPLVAKRE